MKLGRVPFLQCFRVLQSRVNVVKAVVASARDIKGEPLFMRDWDDGFIDAPEVDEQNQPT